MKKPKKRILQKHIKRALNAAIKINSLFEKYHKIAREIV